MTDNDEWLAQDGRVDGADAYAGTAGFVAFGAVRVLVGLVEDARFDYQCRYMKAEKGDARVQAQVAWTVRRMGVT